MKKKFIPEITNIVYGEDMWFNCPHCKKKVDEIHKIRIDGNLTSFCGDCLDKWLKENQDWVKENDKDPRGAFEKCEKCGNNSFQVISEGITSSGEHYPIGQCNICKRLGDNK